MNLNQPYQDLETLAPWRQNIWKRLKINIGKNYQNAVRLKPKDLESILENETHKILWDFKIRWIT